MHPLSHSVPTTGFRRLFVTCLGLGLVLAAMAVRGQSTAPAESDDTPLPHIVELALQPWTGDLDQMIERGILRVVIPVSAVTYFLDGSKQTGPTYEVVQEFEKHLKKKLGKAARDLAVVVIPGRRDRILDMLVEGRADIAAGIITVTEERAKSVGFSPPFLSDVNEVIVTGQGASAASLDDLVGIPIHLRRSTSFWGTVERVNAERSARGAAPLTVVEADENLRTEDMLEMVSTGVFPATIADSPVANVFARYFEGRMTVHDQVPLAEGRSYAWAHRPGDAKLAEALAGFVKIAAKGTLLGNIILNRYTKSTEWIGNVMDPKEHAKLTALVELFRSNGERYGFDWLMVAAQGYQESGLDQSKRSRVGAVGVMQLMPATANDPAIGISGIDDVEHNIHAGVKYLDLLRDKYFDDPAISPLDRELFCFAAYNAGPGNVRKARRRAEKLGLDPNVWFDNVEVAMGQAVSREPVIYVRNIFKYYTAFTLIAAENASKQTAK